MWLSLFYRCCQFNTIDTIDHRGERSGKRPDVEIYGET